MPVAVSGRVLDHDPLQCGDQRESLGAPPADRRLVQFVGAMCGWGTTTASRWVKPLGPTGTYGITRPPDVAERR
ncbi:MAG: hypothetical protein R2705_07300 [Ilumatobacteraceae bacterium]